MGLIRTLFEYGNQAYEGLKQPTAAQQTKAGAAMDNLPEPGTVTLSGQQQEQSSRPRVMIKEFQQGVGQDTAFVQQTLRQKLAEYGVASVRGQVRLGRSETGALEISGAIPTEAKQKIEADINRNPDIKQTFVRLSNQKPALDYVQNVMRLQNAYGGDNSLFSSLLSSNPQNNSLQDIVQRFHKMGSAAAEMTANSGSAFSISIS
ncbi:hypothetical protein EUZ85_10445 [Hahella sp. KA22]|uniref:hypothetical protein n=1 Tax=Hahella sp. KA22 TaxID=1628392 RepID=UPI000FDD8A8B|nr:hypothetical protein [Hahella sp. KA22]AZZ91123.1 hypothetical protein ENC22_07890 [Hahella sp. KA22]QAY54491.1 hypothetical protein EUZ85_10445 [Hahella sp. KA22]